MNELITIEKVRGFIGENGIIFLNLEDVARGLGFVDVKNEIAKNFQLKVANKILPAIRKTGMYATDELLNNPDLAIRAFMKLKEEMIRRQELEKKIEEQQPKVDFYNDVTGSDTTAEIGTVAKVLNFKSVGRNTLFDILRRQGILQRDNMPFQTYVDRGYFRVVESKWNAPNGDVKVNYKTVVYQKGIEYISKILRDLGYEKIGEILN